MHDESVRQRKLLKAMGFTAEDLEAVASDVNRRNSEAVVSQVHAMPVKADPKAERPRGRLAKKLRDIAEGRRPAVEEPKPKGKRGRPKGSKNRKASEKAEAAKPEQKRKPGRPKGSKNKKTLIREAELAKREKRMKRKNDSG